MPPAKSCQGILLLCLVIFMPISTVFGQLQTNTIFAGRIEKEYQLRLAALTAAPDDPSNCWQFARACFDWADFATNEVQREDISRQGIAAAKRLIDKHPKSAAGHYYLGMDYGQLAEAVEPSLEAFHLVRDIEHEFKVTAQLDPHYDYAGPARNLGLLYRDAPGWPLSIGSKRKAHENLVLAVQQNPEYPENELNLAESQVHWHQYDEAAQTVRKLAAIWPAALTNFTGTAWEPSWADWKPRRTAIEAAVKAYASSAAAP